VVPEGAVRVIPQEIVDFSDGRARLAAPVGDTCFIRGAGADFAAGDRLLEAGTRLAPGAIGLLASANRASIEAVLEPRVAICTSGDELVVPGSALGAGQSVDSASHALAALLRRWGCKPDVRPILPDDLEATISELGGILPSYDLLLCIGGASVGKRDLMRPAAAAIGGRLLFERIAVQPGKPCWHARTEASGLILGLPGNPSSAFVCAHLLLLPLVDRLMNRAPTVAMRPARSACALPPNGEREQYLRAGASYDPEGRLLALALADQDSGLQAALARAQLLIRRLPRAIALAAGETVEVLELSCA
jgi:molybdopterin molybdotransferase